VKKPFTWEMFNRFPGKDYKKLHLQALSREIRIIWQAVSHPKTRFQRKLKLELSSLLVSVADQSFAYNPEGGFRTMK
jgi:hypothetical protein